MLDQAGNEHIGRPKSWRCIASAPPQILYAPVVIGLTLKLEISGSGMDYIGRRARHRSAFRNSPLCAKTLISA